ncbi:MAG: biotin--[acetyl-CoA-carboxylase] ligase [Pyrinomonadaceae bacterium]
MKITILRFDSIGSTNTEALDQARRGAEEGLCIVAEQQTEGRGRFGRTWVSQPGAGLYFSIVLRPAIKPTFFPLLTLMSAVAVFDLLREDFGLDPDIKWVNDILIREKKICGILAETTDGLKGNAVIIGVGLNLRQTNFPRELADSATSIEELTGEIPDREKVLEFLTRHLSGVYSSLQGENGPETIRRQWCARSSYSRGKPVRVSLGEEIFTGITCGIEENGALRVKNKNGLIRIVQAGDVEKLREAN